ncbi:hypothetical protein TRAPUB_6743 [Trametes pubescens]|uniref:Chromo domain-containing protein n=1 Tax=Trametes pubescens TaxID=154538 RepID=A0A1M2V554_TRAPU|nr:hypothetical protein TRAPUB_6743 [Trametes pubescens]
MSRGNHDSSPFESDSDDTQTRFIPRDDDDENLWDAIEILEERGDKYKVRWDGFDRKTGKPWPPTWEFKRDCNDELKHTWKMKKQAKKNRKKSTANGRQSKVRGSIASAKGKTRSESTSTATTTRQSRRNAKDPIPSTSARPPSRALSPRASTSHAPLPAPGPSRQRKSARDSCEDDTSGAAAESVRPRKKRKVEVEIVKSSPARPPAPPESSHEVVARKKFGKVVVSPADVEDEDANTPHTVRNGSARPAGSAKGKGRALDSVEGGDEGTSAAVPLSKVGPPRHLKRKRQSKSHESVPSRTHSGGARGSESPVILGRPRQEPIGQHESGRSSSRSAKVTPSGSSSHSPARQPIRPPNATNGRAPNPKAVVNSRRSKSSTLAQLEQESESDDEELMNPSFLKALQKAKSWSASAQISPETKRVLAQEEEESTQEAANWIPPPSPPAVQPDSPPQAERQPVRSSSHRRDENAEAGPSKPSGRPALQGRPSANDTFSREGIVPETQPYPGPGSSDHRTRPSPSDAFVTGQNLPSTPPRALFERQPTSSQIPSSVKAKMKPKRKTTKELRPVPVMSPSVFRSHLPSADDEEIEEFSSPEKDTRRKKRALDIPTQDSIEEAVFTQHMDSFMDWEGGAQPAAEENRLELSLGPRLPPPDEEGGPRLAMTTVLAKAPSKGAPLKPQNLQKSRSCGSCQQQVPRNGPKRIASHRHVDLSLNTQIAELNATLEEKEEQLTQLEAQMEELLSHIAQLKTERTEETASHQAELKALQEASDDKNEQISQLESQLVELQLQLTQQASDADNERERHELQVQELRESLEERSEQLSQLESALVELQEELATAVADSERFVAAARDAADSDHKHAEQILTAQQQVTTLEQELTDVRARLLKAEEESAALTSRLATSTQEWERRFKYAEDDRDMFKNLYSEASTHATRLAAENAELETRATLAEGQVRDGLAMIRGTFEGQVRTLREEAEKWRAMCAVLTAKDARTDDDVRRRAVLEPRLREENARLKEEAEIVRADMEKMAAIITQMTEQRERSEEDAHADADAEMDEDGEADAEDSSPWHGKAFRVLNGGRSISPRGSLEPGELEEIVYACHYVQDGRLCHKPFATPEDVAEHAQKAHYPDVVELIGM